MTPRRLMFATLFAVSMGLLEAAVVVYLRLLYYPDGFQFPLIVFPTSILAVETVREGATIFMLLSVAMLTGRTGWERFAYFSFLFGIWDIIYYAGLYVWVHWPASFMTWDILFLIPAIWAGPVLAPVIISLCLIGAALVILRYEALRIRIHVEIPDLLALAVSLGLLLWAFMANHEVVSAGRAPERFPWWIFGVGVALAWAVLGKVVMMNPRSRLPRRYGIK